MGLLIKRLEQALRFWEDTHFLIYRLSTAMDKMRIELAQRPVRLGGHPLSLPLLVPMTNPAIHWNELRDDLLNSAVIGIDDEKYTSPDLSEPVSGLRYLPAALSEWTRSSRRVFHLTEELQTLLSMTSLENVRWSDVRWPFESFFVSLESPIVSEDGMRWDAVLVFRGESSAKDGEMLFLTFFPEELEKYRPLDFMERDRFNKLHRQESWTKLTEKLYMKIKVNDALHPPKAVALLPDHIHDSPVTESLGEMYEKYGYGLLNPYNLAFDAGIRIVVGLCVYLGTLSNTSEHRSAWSNNLPESGQKRDPRAITSKSQICVVNSTYKFSQEEKETVAAFRNAPHSEMCAHWRRGHWRKMPGMGQDPAALKTVWVRPAFVRKDRLQIGELPGGAITQL